MTLTICSLNVNALSNFHVHDACCCWWRHIWLVSPLGYALSLKKILLGMYFGVGVLTAFIIVVGLETGRNLRARSKATTLDGVPIRITCCGISAPNQSAPWTGAGVC